MAKHGGGGRGRGPMSTVTLVAIAAFALIAGYVLLRLGAAYLDLGR